MDEREFQEKLEVEQKARERVAIQTVITAKKNTNYYNQTKHNRKFERTFRSHVSTNK